MNLLDYAQGLAAWKKWIGYQNHSNKCRTSKEIPLAPMGSSLPINTEGEGGHPNLFGKKLTKGERRRKIKRRDVTKNFMNWQIQKYFYYPLLCHNIVENRTIVCVICFQLKLRFKVQIWLCELSKLQRYAKQRIGNWN